MGFLDVFRSKPAPAPAPAATSRRVPSMKGLVRMMGFASGDTNRLTGDWSTNPVPAEYIIHRYQRTLVARSREQAHNNDYMKGYLRLVRQNIVGAPGIILQSQSKDKRRRAAVEASFRKWGKRQHCDVTGKLSWRAIQNACAETAARDGEFMLRKVYGPAAGPYGFALQMLDPQRCPVDLDKFDLPNGEFVRAGIKYNSFGKPLAFAFNDQSADRANMAYSYGGRSVTWIPADEIIHGFIPEMVGQKRGLPWLSTGLFRMKQMGATEDAAIVNARVGAAKMGFIKFAEGHGLEYNEDEPLEIDAEAGAFPVLPEGASMEPFNPQYPSGEFAGFMKHCLRAMATGGGVSYHNLAQDLEGVNFSSIRQGTLDEREFFKERQEWLIEELCEVVAEAWTEKALLAGMVKDEDGRTVSATHIDDCSLRNWQGRRWSWIDPRADMDAAEAAKNNLLAAPGQLIRESGRDPETVWAEIGADIKAMQAAGIPIEIIKLSMGEKPVAPKPAPPKDA